MELNVLEIRQQLINELKNEVDTAFEKCDMEQPSETITVEQKLGYQKLSDLIKDKSDSEIIDFGIYESAKGDVVVKNPHDYPDLLKFAIGKFWPNDSSYQSLEAEDRLRHEAGHYVSLFSAPDSKLSYGVHFYKEGQSGVKNFIPFVGL